MASPNIGGRFMEFEGVRFPPLPSDSYSPSLDGQVTKWIPHDISQEELPTCLCLSWAFVLSLYTTSSDVLFGVLDDTQGQGKGANALVPCHLNLDSVDTVHAGCAMVNQYWQISRHFEQMGLDNLRTSSAEATRLCDFRHVLVMRPMAGLDEPSSSRLSVSLSSQYPLVLICGLDREGVTVHVHFDSTVLSPEVFESVLHTFSHTLAQVTSTANLDTRWTDIQTSNPDDLKKSLHWNTQSSTETSRECVHHRIERHATERPLAPAICAWDGDFSYGELDQSASYLAHQLFHAGLTSEGLVFILSEKSKWTPVAIHAVLKAGGAFSLMDPSQPTHRLATLSDLACPHLILTSKQQYAKACFLGPEVMIIEEMSAEPPAKDPEMPRGRERVRVESHHMLHVGFTSGSTGTPKGVVTDHAALTSGESVAGLDSSSRVLQSTSYSFSACMWEHLVALTYGACLCIPAEDELQNDIEGAIHRLGVTWAMITPSVARVLEPTKVPSIQTMFLVGEAIGRLEVGKWAHQVALHSMYAQSECGSPIITKRILEPRDLSTVGSPGAAIGWIVDAQDHNRLMPLGAEGELVLHGPCLARGYLHNPEQTDATFITSPAWTRQVGCASTTRFLKTGDLFSRSPVDGSYQFRGRKGGKVKVRGQRIELAEIEYHLRAQFPEASHVVAELVRPRDADSQYGMLVAVIPVASARPNGGNAAAHCQLLPPDTAFLARARRALDQMSEVLPSYMIPTSFIPVASLPRTASGKMHRRLLIETISQLSRKEILAYMTVSKLYRPPSTEREALLQSVLVKTLSLAAEDVGMDESFLSLGGDSLSARQLVTLARGEGLSLTVIDCLQQPSLSSLAECAKTSHPEPVDHTPAIQADPFSSLRHDFFHNLPPDLTADMIEDIAPVRETQLFLVQYQILDYLQIRMTGPLDPVRLRRACEDLVQSHPILRTIFLPFQTEHVQVILRAVDVPWRVVSPPAAGHDADLWAHAVCAEDRSTPTPLSGPFLKFILLQDASLQQHTLIIRISHAQFDGLCLDTLLGDLAQLYRERSSPLNIQTTYADFVRKCATLRTPPALQFWQTLLADATPTALPLTPSTAPQEAACIVATQDIPTALPPPAGTTWATVVKAAWAQVLRERTHQADVIFCQMVNCRFVDVPAPERIVGPCLNPVPVRVRAPPTWTVRDLLQAVQDQHVASLEHQTLEWGDIVAHCTPWPRDTEIDSIVLHENIDASPVTTAEGHAVWRLKAHSVDNPPERTIYLYTYPQPDSLYAVLVLSSAVGCQAEAQRLVRRFGEVVGLFVHRPGAMLSAL
ncbi:acetyl-CoA synthetase-like protein [Aspergillus japonicus CBS 114.51]|uniref:Acetyl-CoA synthetase-like protein n=1 Tax=Aspergillus japonicus CBS 114.51 TaxID=1448312 RepID=A0A8T8WVP1_ASPJA|nr:acetyl-CoA synthetase-like protein [Aspergillus japonicus CBS 114.51]RAH79918.1 acetyl-CoA synthetase-like protein [Aspergillus japonicus CBS 114.51]